MSSGDRFSYKTATVLDQAFLDACHDNLTCDLEMAADVEASDGSTLHVSDRNKYVGGTFYEALIEFPTIRRTLGDWLSPQTEFDTMPLTLSNVDKRFNRLMPEGADFGGWIDRNITINIGLRDVASTYTPIFNGAITPEAGFGRTVKSVKLVARNAFDKLNVNIPPNLFTVASYPNIEQKNVGKAKPLIWGDYTTQLSDRPAVVPAYVVNGADPAVVGTPFNHVQLVISDNPNRFFDTTNVWLKRGANFYQMAAADITAVSGGSNAFEIIQNGSTVVDAVPFALASGDEFYVQVKGAAVTGGYHDNFIQTARDILTNYGTALITDFDATWNAARDKATPAESAIVGFKCRIWQQETISALALAQSLLSQVRCEMFISRLEKIAINQMHFDAFVASPTFEIQNWDVVQDSWTPAIDVRNNFNRCKGFYSQMPDTGQNEFETAYYHNAAAITQARRTIEKGLVFPNMYVAQDVAYQTIEILKLASAFAELVECTLTWRSLLQDLGGFVKVNVKIGSSQYTNVPMMIRSIGFDPGKMSMPVRFWSFQMTPFSASWNPSNPGIVSGYNAIITQE